jgi:hypothetical protein
MNREHIFISKKRTDFETVNQNNMEFNARKVSIEQDF